MDNQLIIFIVFVFIAAFFAIEAIYYWWVGKFGAESSRLKRRLDVITDHDSDSISHYQSILKTRYANNSGLTRFIFNLPFADGLEMLIMQSGKIWPISKLLQYMAFAGAVGLVLCIVLGLNIVVTAVLVILATILPVIYLLRERAKRFDKFEEQLPEAIDSICRSLKSGHAFSSAFGMVGEDFQDPIAAEFRITMEENNLGVNFYDAMQNLAKRIPLTDLRFFVVAVSIQRETGGNLTEILSSISQVIRDRFKLFRHVKVVSAEGRMSAWVLCSMPFVMMLFLSTANENYSELMFGTPTGQYLLKVAAVLMVVAIIWIRGIVKVKI
jgi:tight adherence protein B